MAINFPNNPYVNDTFTVGGIKFTFTGVKWESGAVVEISSDTTPSLGGALDAGTHNINNVGVITATTFNGNLIGNVTGTATTATYAQTAGVSTYASTAGISTYATTAGVSTYASTAGVSTNAQGLTGTPNITVGTVTGTDATFSGNLTVNGTTTTIDTAVTAVDSLQIDGSVAIGTATGETNFLTTINGDLSLGEKSGADNTYIDQKQNGSLEIINSGRTSNEGSVRINRHNNISGDTTYFRDFVVYDGKGTALLTVDGSAGSVSDSIGPLRRLGIQGASGSFTLAADHAGKLVRSTGNGSTLTIPQNIFSAGDMISIFNVSTGNNTIAQGTGATLYNTADGATGNRTLGPKGVCTILCTSTNEFIISGSQVS